MKKLLFFLFTFIGGAAVHAQKVYFIYLQSENGSPFFIKMAEKVQSSSASGYVILSGLKDSTYVFSVGFPGKTAESKFSVALNKQDKGYLLKAFEGGLGLFDLQSLAITKAISFTKEPDPIDPVLASAADPFTRLLAQASDEPSLLISGPNPAVPKEMKEQTLLARAEERKDLKPDTSPNAVLPAAVSTSLATATLRTEEDKHPVDTTTDKKPVENLVTAVPGVVSAIDIVAEETFRRSVITRRSESSTTEGFGLVFLDDQAGVVDTIRLLIPNPKVLAKITESVEGIEDEKAQKEASGSANASAPANPDGDRLISAQKPACAAVASDKDFLRLRRNMVAEESDEAMIAVAKKTFAEKCFSTEQIKNLGVLFLLPSGKFDFFSVAYLHLSDKEQVAVLQSEIPDNEYAMRFKALIGNTK